MTSLSQFETEKTGFKLSLANSLDLIKWNSDGLVPAIAQDVNTKEVLMLAWMNKESLTLTLREKQVCYWSRSRKALWRKGESSGHIQTLIGLKIDCDGDTLLLTVNQQGPACHTERKSCFFWQAEPETNHLTLIDHD